MRGIQIKIQRVLACMLTLLLVVGLVPVLPESPYALAEEASDVIVLDNEAFEENVTVLGGTPDNVTELDDAEPNGASDLDSPITLDDESIDELLDEPKLVVQDVSAAIEDVASEEDTVLEAQSVSVSNPRIKADPTMKSGQVATWDCVWFGSYPQGEVISSDAIYGSLQSASWNSNGDATVSGKKYRRISKQDTENGGSRWSDDGYGSAAYRYFRYEPIKWRVLEVNGNTALVVADVALDDQCYDTNDTTAVWLTSSVRSWLNGYEASCNLSGMDFTSKNFIDTAFSSNEYSAIVSTNLAKADQKYDVTAGDYITECYGTSDSVFLLSEAEVCDLSYGFASDYGTYDEARRCKTSDYARAMGVWRAYPEWYESEYEGDCYWWLRSIGLFTHNAADVCYDGSVNRDGNHVCHNLPAVRPALNLSLAFSHLQAAGTVSSNGVVKEPATKPISTVTISPTNYSYDGAQKNPTVTVKDGTKTLALNTDYTLTSPSGRTNVGSYTYTVTGKGNYTGTKSASFTISAKAISSCTVSLSPTSYTYDGKAKTPAVTVKDGSKTLSKDIDYTIKYEGNVNAGTAKATVTGKGNYTGTKSASFTISNPKKKSISSCTLALTPTSYTYDGTQKTPTLMVKDESTTLTENTHYTVSWPDGRTSAGTYTVTVTGKDSYSGTKSASFTISAKAISSCTVSLSPTSYTYDGKAKTPTVTVKDGTKKLTKGTDYTVKYEGNVNVGTAKATVTGKGNYKGSKTASFAIKSKTRAAFAWKTDNWNFNNTGRTGYPDYFKSGRYIDQINSKYLNALKNNLTNTEYWWVFTGGKWANGQYYSPWIYEPWGGSCYGMAATTLLAREGLLPFSQYKTGASTLYQLPTPKENVDISSLITYYQMLQVKDNTQARRRYVKKRTNKENIGEIESLLGTHNTVLLGISQEKTGFSHALLAYGRESGSWTKDGVTYQARICIYDPNSSMARDENRFLYYNTRTYSWTIPYYASSYEVKSGVGAIIANIAFDSAEVNRGGCLPGVQALKSADTIARLDTLSISGNRSVTKVTEGSSGYMDRYNDPGDIEEDYSVFYCNPTGGWGSAGYNLYDTESAYRVRQENPVNLELIMNYGDCLMTASSVAGEGAVFDPKGYVQVSGESADYEMSMTLNERCPTDWSTLSVRGSGADAASLEKVSDGYVLESDSLKGVSVSANNRTNSASTDFTTNYKKVLIYEIDKTTIGVKVDRDDNGSFETVIVDGRKPQTVTAANKTVGVGKTVSLGAKTSGDGKLTYKSSDTSVATVSAKGVVTGKKAGTATVTITAAATASYKKATKKVTVTVKKANTLKAAAKKATVTATLKTLKSKAVTLASNVTVSKAKGTVSYANASADATAKKFKVDASTGTLTVPKGTKKGTYEVKVKVTAKGDKTYLKGTKTVTYKVQVK